jgi:G:T-mismatch repair DNA endonuclease (very short patch repair protein)
MADVHSKETRSYNMSQIRSKDTKPEMLVRGFLHKNGFTYIRLTLCKPCRSFICRRII